MMQVKVHDGEFFERGKLRYIVFALINTTLIVLSFRYDNIRGAILLIALLGAYAYSQMKAALLVDLKIQQEGILVGKTLFRFDQLKGFLIEAEAKTKKIKNLVLILDKDHHTYTFADTEENLQSAIELLQARLPYIEDFTPSTIDKMMKWLKI